LTPQALAAADTSEWTSTKKEISGLGRVVEMLPGKAAVQNGEVAESSALRVSCCQILYSLANNRPRSLRKSWNHSTPSI
jgi:hypothetical protein